jgi:hypothetical protein
MEHDDQPYEQQGYNEWGDPGNTFDKEMNPSNSAYMKELLTH